MPNPKICIFTETYYPVIGGGETQAQLLAEGLIARGFQVILLTRRSDPSLKVVEKYGDLTVYRLPPIGSGQLKKWGLLFSGFPKLFQLRREYDLIFVSGFRIVGISAVIISKLLGKKCVLKADSQGEMSGEFFKGGLRKFGLSLSSLPFKLFLTMRNFVLKQADAFTAITTDIAEELANIRVKNGSVWMIPNSVDSGKFCPVDAVQKDELRRKLDLSQSDKIVVYTGRLVSYKGLPLLLKVWLELCKSYKHVKLLLVGTGGLDIHNCEDELKTFVKENDLEQKVLFTGSVHNVHEYLQAADIFVLPTENDAFPSSLVEAMACKLSVLTTPVGAIKTIVTDGQNGLIIQPGDFQELYEGLEKLIAEPETASSLGEAAWKTVQERYSAEIVTEQYCDLFLKISASSLN